MKCVHLVIEGRVQGVGFRYFAQEQAVRLGLSGWVRNCPDGSVEAYAEGSPAEVDVWTASLRQGPPLAHVETIRFQTPEPAGPLQGFIIR